MQVKDVLISEIIIGPDRQRKDVSGIEELAESIGRLGRLIHPIVIDENKVLIAGERRLTACRALGWSHIPAQSFDDLSEQEKFAIELEENIKRKALTWQEEVAAVAKYHDFMKASEPEWSISKTAEAIGLSPSWTARSVAVAEEINNGNEQVANAERWSIAVGVTERARERRASSVLSSTSAFVDTLQESDDGGEDSASVESGTHQTADDRKTPPLLNADFSKWIIGYDGPKFNMIHCDFPYGVNMDKSGQGANQAHGDYADSEDVFWKLMNDLDSAMENVVAESAHLIFWFSMNYYDDTLSALTKMGWTVNPMPLIWYKTDNVGIMPDAKRRPRQIYETAFFASRGDRQLATGPHGQGPVGNAKGAPGGGKTLHMNEKPVEMLRHFMRLCVDEVSMVLDPTCGSGNALKAAESLGAHKVLGLELNLGFYNIAKDAYYGESSEA